MRGQILSLAEKVWCALESAFYVNVGLSGRIVVFWYMILLWSFVAKSKCITAFRFMSVFPPEPHPLIMEKGLPRPRKRISSCIQPLEVMLQVSGSFEEHAC